MSVILPCGAARDGDVRERERPRLEVLGAARRTAHSCCARGATIDGARGSAQPHKEFALPDVALFIDWENVYYTLRQHREGRLPSSLAILQAILKKAAEHGSLRVKQAIFGQEVAAQDETLLMALEFTGIEPIAVAQRLSGRLLKGRADAVLIARALKMLYKERPDLDTWFIVSGDRDLNALCKALKDEDKRVYLVAGDKALANELRESPYLRDDVFLLEDLLPEIGVAVAAPPRPEEPARRGRGPRRAVRPAAGAPATLAPAREARPAAAIVLPEAPSEEREQRRLAVLLLDQLVALEAQDISREDFVNSVVPASDRAGRRALDALVDAGVAQRHVLARPRGRSRAKGKLGLALNFGSPLVAETVFQLARLLRRVDTVLGKDNRRIPVVEAVIEPLSRADQPGTVQGRAQRRALLETLFNIAEERGAVVTEQMRRDAEEVAMCWLLPEHPLVRYARRPGAAVILLLNFTNAVAERGEERDWTNASLVTELLARSEGDALDRVVGELLQAGAIRGEERGAKRRAGYVLAREHPHVREVLGAVELPEPRHEAGKAPPGEPRRRPTRRGVRGGRGRKRRQRGAAAPAAEVAAEPRAPAEE